MAESTNESDSNEKTDEDDSESGSESDEENEDEFSISGTAEGAKERAKKMRKRSSRRKRTLQSDTETRNLLDDVGDDEDIMDLEESKENSKIGGHLPPSSCIPRLEPRFFEMSEEQINYYTQCFLHLQRKTGEPVSTAGAVNGGDERVVDFFRKSRLDTKTLSKVWALADVNADGFLNHAEFILAMHLIVLHVKARPPARPVASAQPRSAVRHSAAFPLPARGGTPELDRLVDVEQRGGQRVHFARLGSQPAARLDRPLALPPALAAAQPERPADAHEHALRRCGRQQTAVSLRRPSTRAHTTARGDCDRLLRCPARSRGQSTDSAERRGPPPQPPPRAYQTGGKGHGRSVSLDLNTFAATSGHPPFPPHPASASMFHSTGDGDPLVPNGELPIEQKDANDRDDSVFFGKSTASAGDPPNRAFPPKPTADSLSTGAMGSVGMTTSSAFKRPPAAHHHSASLFAGNTATTAALVHPPPFPQRPLNAGRPPAAPVQWTTVATQTERGEGDPNDAEDARGSQSIRPALLDERAFAQLMEGTERMAPAERCAVLRRYNAELENERATLAQVRLQLQLRIDEAESALREFGIRTCSDRLSPEPTPFKPTVL
ncbi:hypothetical protein M3Y99_01946700 [Aphelenchoides fujianensis]|nr:hypothetical protein M3Y99_01946700 [Aphelenchoides fujianensis]